MLQLTFEIFFIFFPNAIDCGARTFSGHWLSFPIVIACMWLRVPSGGVCVCVFFIGEFVFVQRSAGMFVIPGLPSGNI